MSKGRVFQQLYEAPITFMPTYKFDVLDRKSMVRSPSQLNPSKGYDSSPKQRVPAWTDRILYTQQGKLYQLLSSFSHERKRLVVVNEFYQSCMDICVSDHKPVIGRFKIAVPSGTFQSGSFELSHIQES